MDIKENEYQFKQEVLEFYQGWSIIKSTSILSSTSFEGTVTINHEKYSCPKGSTVFFKNRNVSLEEIQMLKRLIDKENYLLANSRVCYSENTEWFDSLHSETW